MSDTEIVVVGKRDSTGKIYGFAELKPGQAYQPRKDEDGGGPDADYVDAIYIRVRVSNKANKAAAVAGAQKLAIAINEIRGILQTTSATTFTANGVVYSVADVLANLERTRWFVTDTQNFKNNGVGTASYSASDFNVDTIYFGSLGDDGYGSPNYESREGMTALVLHELGHLSQAGYDFLQQNMEEYKSRNHGSINGYYDSPFA